MHLDRDRSSGISQIERIQAEIQKAERKRSNSVTAAARFDKVVSMKQLGGKQREGASRTFDVRIDDFNIASVYKNATRGSCFLAPKCEPRIFPRGSRNRHGTRDMSSHRKRNSDSDCLDRSIEFEVLSMPW